MLLLALVPEVALVLLSLALSLLVDEDGCWWMAPIRSCISWPSACCTLLLELLVLLALALVELVLLSLLELELLSLLVPLMLMPIWLSADITLCISPPPWPSGGGGGGLPLTL